jgi:hypothetical protein
MIPAPQEKAEELVIKFLKHSRAEKDIKPMQSAKQCALICVDEIMYYSKRHGFVGLTEYYEEIKEEIKKL